MFQKRAQALRNKHIACLLIIIAGSVLLITWFKTANVQHITPHVTQAIMRKSDRSVPSLTKNIVCCRVHLISVQFRIFDP